MREWEDVEKMERQGRGEGMSRVYFVTKSIMMNSIWMMEQSPSKWEINR